MAGDMNLEKEAGLVDDRSRLYEALRQAMDMEEQGRRHYEELVAKTVNPLAKRLFQELAMDEERHAERFREILHQDVLGELTPFREPGSLENTVQQYYQSLDHGERKQPFDQVSGLEAAMRMEKASQDRYAGLAGEATDPQLARFFDLLTEEEYGHFLALANVHLYLTRTGMWFDIEDSKKWNWMV